MIDNFTAADVERAEQLFLDPSPQYRWNEIIDGVAVRFPDGHTEKRDAVGITFRGFHRVDKSRAGSKEVFDSFFRDNKADLIASLAAVSSREDLHKLLEDWRESILKRLDNVKRHQIEPYNKTRKPIDLYMMNLASLAKDLDGLRHRLMPLLFLPLDSQMFQQAFEGDELRRHGLSQNSTYGHLRTEASYCDLQQIAAKRAHAIGQETGRTVHPIYFEMLWRDRRGGGGGNIFEASPMRS